MDQTQGNARKKSAGQKILIKWQMGVFCPLGTAEQWVEKLINVIQLTSKLIVVCEARNVLRVSCLQWAKLVLITCSAEQTNFIQSSPWPGPGRGQHSQEREKPRHSSQYYWEGGDCTELSQCCCNQSDHALDWAALQWSKCHSRAAPHHLSQLSQQWTGQARPGQADLNLGKTNRLEMISIWNVSVLICLQLIWEISYSVVWTINIWGEVRWGNSGLQQGIIPAATGPASPPAWQMMIVPCQGSKDPVAKYFPTNVKLTFSVIQSPTKHVA